MDSSREIPKGKEDAPFPVSFPVTTDQQDEVGDGVRNVGNWL